MPEPRVMIGVPHLGPLPGYFVDSLMGVLAAPPHRFVLQRVERKPTDVARNEIVRSFLALPEATHLFFMDSDMVFPREAVSRLLSRGKDIISGLYIARSNLATPHFYERDHEDERGVWYHTMVRPFAEWLEAHPEHLTAPIAKVYEDTPDSLIRTDALGGGCLLISRRVLEAMEPPWFKFTHPDGYGGEDFYFCGKAAQLGFESWGDFSVHCGHEAAMTFVSAASFTEDFRLGTSEAVDLSVPIIAEIGPTGAADLTYGPRDPGFVWPEHIEGYMSYSKCLLLYRLAASLPPEALIVELGTYKGRTTVSMAQSGRQILSIDHFNGETEEALGHGFADHVAGSYLQEFRDNTAGLSNVSVVIGKTSNGPMEHAHMRAHMVVIDAAHDYESVRADVAAWLPALQPGGYLAFDDTDFPGVAKVVGELGQVGWRAVKTAGSLIVLQQQTEGGAAA